MTFAFFTSLTFGVYLLFSYLNNKIKNSFLNPYMMSVFTLFGLFILANNYPNIFKFVYSDYKETDTFLSSFIPIATMGFASGIHNQIASLKKYAIIVLLCSCFSITLSSVLIVGLGTLLKIDKSLIMSLLPRSVSTSFGIEAANLLRGNPTITATAITITGIIGSVFAVPTLKFLKIKNGVPIGVALGTTTHIIGTTKAMEIGEFEGSISSFSLVVSGFYLTFIVIPVMEIINK